MARSDRFSQTGLAAAVIGVAAGLAACQSSPSVRAKAQAKPAGIQYPATTRVEQVDAYHGIQISDPYRWLENPESPALREWIEAQNAVTFSYLNSIPQRSSIKERLTKLWKPRP